MRFEAVVERVERLPDPLPDFDHVLMPVVVGRDDPIAGRFSRTPPAATRPAAVLVLVYPDTQGEARVVLIERATHDGHHSGEVSFPGGKAEPDDADPEATAIREATEEVGLDAATVELRVVGRLEAFWIPVSDFHVTPVLALAGRTPVMRPDPREVARIVEPPVDRFLPSASIDIVERTIDGWPLRYGAYAIDGLSVWGATARILSQLGAALEDR